MAVIRPFCCIRPAGELAGRVAALPYDVYSREEAKREIEREPLSFLSVDRAEAGLPDTVDAYDGQVYEKAREALARFEREGVLIREEEPCMYLYELTMDGHTQTGIAACAAVDDYLNGVVKKHENTREDKERDRIRHVDALNAQTGPIFLAYRARKGLRALLEEIKEGEALYDFEAADGIRHRVFRIGEAERITALIKEIGEAGDVYIADGHHRAASAVKVALKRRKERPDYDGSEEFNYFLSVLFPDEELRILPYNRVVRDLNGLSAEAFLERVQEHFRIVEPDGAQEAKHPSEKGRMGMLLDGTWYVLEAREEIRSEDPIRGLDVSLLQDYILAPVLGVEDPRTDQRIEFIGGIRGSAELERRCGDDMRVAFSMYPTSMEELLAVADAGLLMPPKSTWFEPKLRSGLFIHEED
ncbi:DUF1015 domain-containing protein [Otoolea muris]|uniref:DUF1015 domain-containing protein n=1 Tax=Otoolea muris TaxID=2941515 RepID=UPI00203F431A|nr:DUF1015 family protein [Otoolea muris]